MELHTVLCFILLIFVSTTEERSYNGPPIASEQSRHIPSTNVLSFRRDSVEHVPEVEPSYSIKKGSYMTLEEFGSKSLPLRAAVESVPDAIEGTKRLPLRDAVEKRPELEQESLNTRRFSFNQAKPVEQFQRNVAYQLPVYFTQANQFKTLINSYSISPYRISNGYQQLLVSPIINRGRSLKLGMSNLRFYMFPNIKFVDNNYEDSKKIVCYVEAAAAYRRQPLTFTAEDLDANLCTHVIYAFASLDPDSYNAVANDEEYDIVQGGYKSVVSLKRFNKNLKVLLAVGGLKDQTSHRFHEMISNANKRRNFIRSTFNLIKQHGFDGVEIHWEYPAMEELGGRPEDKEHFQLFLEELAEIFKQSGLLVALAVPSSRFRIEDGYLPAKLNDVVDFVNVQAYDFHRERDPVADHHSNLNARPNDEGVNIFINVDYAVQFWIRNGLQSNKIILGIPFFGRSFTLKYPNDTEVGAQIKGPGAEGFYTQTRGFLAYFEICDMLVNEGWYRGHDADGSSYIVNGDQWVGYDDEESIRKKLSYVKKHNLGGVYAWAVDLDDFKGLCGNKWPLLGTINKQLKDKSPMLIADLHTPTKPFGTCQSEGYYSDPKNCAGYYVCKNGLSYHLSCGPNKMFDSTNGKCVKLNARKCRPGETVYIHHHLKSASQQLRSLEDDDEPKVVCYVTNWSFYRKSDGKFVPEHIDQRLCTHVVYAFATLDPETLLLKEFDPWADLDNNLYERITSLKDTKVLLSLGGWTDSAGDKYSKLVSDGSARRRFVVGTVGFLRRHGFQGLHFDWNYPICWQSNCKKGPASDKPNFSKLMQELANEFSKQNPPLLLAAAISGYKEVIDVAYDLPALGKSLDFMSVMTYDYHGAWEGKTGHVSPLYQQPTDKYPQYNTNYTMEYLVSKGAPRGKLLVSIPFYGQSFTLPKSGSHDEGAPSIGPGAAGEFTKQPGMLAYYEICHRVKYQNWMSRKSALGAGPYAYSKDQWVGYEDTNSIKEKANYIRTSGFAGAVAWTIDLDDFNNKCCSGSFPLLHSLNEALGRTSPMSTQADCTKPPAPSTPAPPETTTGVDSGAATSGHNHNHEWTTGTTKRTTTSPWWTTSSTTRKPSTVTSPWWSSTSRRPSSSISTWWTPSSEPPSSTWWSTSKTSTTKRPQTTPWWDATHPTHSSSTTSSTTRKPPSPDDGSWIPPPTVVRPDPQKPPQMSCEPGQYLADSNNCNAFYRCVGGELSKQYCAGGLHWNKEKNICDWPSSAKCNELPYMGTTSRPSTAYSQTTEYHWSTTSATTLTHYTETEMTMDCDTGAYYPHEKCNMFYVCVNNQLLAQSCAPGLNWDDHKGMCDYMYKVKCIGRKKLAQQYTYFHDSTLLKPQPYASCGENMFAPFPGDCTQYMQCLWGKYEIFQCAPGLYWNSEMKICDWPKGSHCEQTDNEIEPAVPDPEGPSEPSYKPTTSKPSTTSKPQSTTEWQYQPPTTSEPGENPWEWHPPIPPTSEKPPLSEPLKPKSDYFKIVCYFTNWAWYRQGQGKYLPEDIDENLCTHIVYGFAVLDFSNLIIKAHDSWADFDNQFYKRVIAYKSKGVKVSIAIGGWNDSQGDKYSRLVNNPSARSRFIEHIVKFLDKWGFDGLDLDWEYPKCWQVDCKKGPDSDKPAFSAFVKELKEAFRPKGYLLSAAVSPSKTVIDAGYDVPVLGEYLDWVAVMTYDFHGQWDKKTGHVAPLFYHPKDEVTWFNSNFSLHYWISEGVPRRKIVMGMPLYGQSFRLENEKENGLNAMAPGPGEAGEFTKAGGFLAYYEICDRVQNRGWTVVKDPKRRMGPYAYKGNQWVSYDDQEMIRIKSEFIRRMDLGGGMIWALDLDDFKNKCGGGRHPLLTTIRNVLADEGTGVPEPIPPIDDSDETKPAVEAVEVEVETHQASTVDGSPIAPSTPQSTSIVDVNSEFKVVCYFTNWAWYRQGRGKYLPSDIDPNLCTHIVYGFAVLDGDSLIIKPHDTWADFDNKFYEKVTAFKAKGIKVLIAIGGWNDSAGDKYSRLVNDPGARRRFITRVMDFIEENNFDGLDLDWEYPKCWQVDCNKGPATDKPAFADLVKELHEAFRPKGWLLSAAVSPSKRVVDAGYDVPALNTYLDWIAVMTYDYHGQWDKVTGHVAPMYAHPEDIDATFNANFTINYWIEQGADRKKIVMGMPMYGQSFSLAETNDNGLNAPTYGGGEAGEETRARGFLAYYEICSNIIKKDWKIVRDRQGRIGPYAYLRDQWVSFDDIGMIRHKSEYIKAMGLGGGMIWALDLDDFKNECGCEEYPLLRTINRVLRDYAVPDPKCVLGKGQDKPLGKPSTQGPPSWQVTSSTTSKPMMPSTEPPLMSLSCNGNAFMLDPTNCNQYYLCNQGHYTLQSCPSGLYWNQNHCDWPENTSCHPDGTTTETSEPNQEPTAPPAVETSTSYIPPVPSSTEYIPAASGEYKVVCYFTNWAWYRQGEGKYLPSDIDPTLCTHINYGFAVLDPNTLTIKPHDSWADIDNDFYSKVVAYKSKGIKVLIAIGGWNDSLGDKYSRLVNNPEARARFVANVLQFIEKWGFDGLDLDWEYPKCWQVDCNKGPDSDKQGFASFVKELSVAFRPKGLLLSSAVSPSKAVIDAGYDVPTLSQYFDWIAVMTYDFHGHWDKQTGHVAPLYYYPGDLYDYFNANFSMHYWIEKGADPKKLIMGMPLYGQSFSLADSSKYGINEAAYGPGEAGEATRAGGFLAFYEICDRVKSRSWTVKRDPLGRIGPYAHMGNQWVSYDDIADIRRKSQFVKSLGLGGGMIWALDLDDFRNKCGCGKHPLLKTMNQELRGIPSDITVENCT
ncbi:probable chitinase 10 isoform X2 [Anthonomus grandis grandis]|uniref:probable chitinase 10 isoform X2 n=1 Tax=Anthonomus grandis grandis TaxID=2921223 RepID=UPI002166936A|nr:probable chitinase 10 isoform X2 [Anthonomus grandis grandis]